MVKRATEASLPRGRLCPSPCAVSWCFMPSQPVLLYQGDGPCAKAWDDGTVTDVSAAKIMCVFYPQDLCLMSSQPGLPQSP